MSHTDMPRHELGKTESFLSYDTLKGVNDVDSARQFIYHPSDNYFVPSAEFHNRALMLGIGFSAAAICEELRENGYAGLVEIETINPRPGINQIRGRPVIAA